VAGWVILLPLAACKPPAFAEHASDLLQNPPAELRAGQSAFWNDPGRQSVGMLELGDGLYAHNGRACKIARATFIDHGRATAGSEGLLYCRDLVGDWQIEPATMCRQVDGAATCRGPDGDYVAMARMDR